MHTCVHAGTTREFITEIWCIQLASWLSRLWKAVVFMSKAGAWGTQGRQSRRTDGCEGGTARTVWNPNSWARAHGDRLKPKAVHTAFDLGEAATLQTPGSSSQNSTHTSLTRQRSWRRIQEKVGQLSARHPSFKSPTRISPVIQYHQKQTGRRILVNK